MALPSEKVQELKQIIHNHLSQMNVHSRIKEYVDESFRGEDPERSGIDEAGMLNALKERGIVDDVMNTLKFEGLEREPRRSKEKKRTEAFEEIPTRGNAICFGRRNVTVWTHKRHELACSPGQLLLCVNKRSGSFAGLQPHNKQLENILKNVINRLMHHKASFTL